MAITGSDFVQLKCINRDALHSRAAALQLCAYHIFHKLACVSTTAAMVESLPARLRGSERE